MDALPASHLHLHAHLSSRKDAGTVWRPVPGSAGEQSPIRRGDPSKGQVLPRPVEGTPVSPITLGRCRKDKKQEIAIFSTLPFNYC